MQSGRELDSSLYLSNALTVRVRRRRERGLYTVGVEQSETKYLVWKSLQWFSTNRAKQDISSLDSSWSRVQRNRAQSCHGTDLLPGQASSSTATSLLCLDNDHSFDSKR
ncbi:hypothetical protein Mapa_003802 [Marchantia paleacea]|nr:hypothetical protein Mapa_003802 [Marchantia paleacea]